MLSVVVAALRLLTSVSGTEPEKVSCIDLLAVPLGHVPTIDSLKNKVLFSLNTTILLLTVSKNGANVPDDGVSVFSRLTRLVGKLRVELEAAKSKLNEQREYYEGVIADGSKRIAELEKSEEQLISERDHAESALADMYFAATGDRPEWSNLFGFSDAVDAVVDRIADLEAKQPSPVVPEGLIKAVRFYEQVKRENPPAETGAWKDAVDWVLKEACQAVNIGIKGE